MGVVFDLLGYALRPSLHLALCRRVATHDLLLTEEGFWGSAIGGMPALFIKFLLLLS